MKERKPRSGDGKGLPPENSEGLEAKLLLIETLPHSKPSFLTCEKSTASSYTARDGKVCHA